MNLLIVIAAATLGALAGWIARANLNRLAYRNEDEQQQPVPGPRWWVIGANAASAATTAGLATAPGPGWAWVALVPLALTGPWLAAVDLDVYRIPNRTLTPTAATTIAALTWLGFVDPSQALIGILGGIIAGGLFAILHAATRGGIGFGDVKLVTVIGLAIGPLGLATLWMALIVGPLAAVIWAKTTRQPAGFAYGPWLLLGAWFAAASAVLN